MEIRLSGAAVLVAGATAIVVAADARARIPRGVEIAGVSVGGVSAAEAEGLVLASAAEEAEQPLVGPELIFRSSARGG